MKCREIYREENEAVAERFELSMGRIREICSEEMGNKNFEVYYQPIYSIKEKKFVSLVVYFHNVQNDVEDKQSGDIMLKGEKFCMTLAGNVVKYDGKTQWVFISEYNEVSVTEPTKEELRREIEHQKAIFALQQGKGETDVEI